MNDRFLVAKYIKEFIISLDDLVVNFPRKEFVIKDRIINDSMDILEYVYIANISNNKDLKIKILGKISMLDFYLEKSYSSNLISERVLRKYSSKLSNISKKV